MGPGSRARRAAPLAVVALLVAIGGPYAHSAAVRGARQPAAGLGSAASDVCPGSKPGTDQATTNVSATGLAGTTLPPDPAVSTLQVITLRVSGFAPRAEVATRLARTTTTTDVFADSSGVATYRYSLAMLKKGSYRLVFQGSPRLSGRTAGGNVAVTVPRIGIFPFRVACSTPPIKPLRLVTASLTLARSPAKVTIGQNATVTGVLSGSAGAARIPSAKIALWASPGGASWRRVSTHITDTGGTVAWTVHPQWSTRYQLRYAGETKPDVRISAARSRIVTLAVRVHASLTVPRSWTPGRPEVVVGSVLPTTIRQVVYLQVDKRTLRGRTNANGKARFRVALAKGSHSLRLRVPGDKRNAGGYSPKRSVTVP